MIAISQIWPFVIRTTKLGIFILTKYPYIVLGRHPGTRPFCHIRPNQYCFLPDRCTSGRTPWQGEWKGLLWNRLHMMPQMPGRKNILVHDRPFYEWIPLDRPRVGSNLSWLAQNKSSTSLAWPRIGLYVTSLDSLRKGLKPSIWAQNEPPSSLGKPSTGPVFNFGLTVWGTKIHLVFNWRLLQVW